MNDQHLPIVLITEILIKMFENCLKIKKS